VQFYDKRLLLFDKRLSTMQLAQKFKTDYLYVTGFGNSNADLDFINENYDYKSLIIDNSNSNHLINKLQQQAEAQRINYHTLLRNKSVLISSN